MIQIESLEYLHNFSHVKVKSKTDIQDIATKLKKPLLQTKTSIAVISDGVLYKFEHGNSNNKGSGKRN